MRRPKVKTLFGAGRCVCARRKKALQGHLASENRSHTKAVGGVVSLSARTNSIRPLENGMERRSERKRFARQGRGGFAMCLRGSKTASLNNNNNENSLGLFLVIKSWLMIANLLMDCPRSKNSVVCRFSKSHGMQIHFEQPHNRDIWAYILPLRVRITSYQNEEQRDEIFFDRFQNDIPLKCFVFILLAFFKSTFQFHGNIINGKAKEMISFVQNLIILVTILHKIFMSKRGPWLKIS